MSAALHGAAPWGLHFSLEYSIGRVAMGASLDYSIGLTFVFFAVTGYPQPHTYRSWARIQGPIRNIISV